MPEASEYKFTLPEVASLLVKQTGLTSGLWQLNVEFGFGAATAGPTPTDVKPTAMVAVQRLGLTRLPADATPEQSKSALTVDASKLTD
jgi:hypothetical protein